MPTIPAGAIPITNWETYYACPDGRIYSSRRNKFLQASLGEDGYLLVSLPRLNRKPGERADMSIRVAPLICTAFHGKRPDGLTVSHLNGNRVDDRAENLAWETYQDNIARKHEHGTMPIGSKANGAKLTEDQVIAIRKDERSNRVIAKEYGITHAHVSKIKRRIYWSHVK